MVFLKTSDVNPIKTVTSFNVHGSRRKQHEIRGSEAFFLNSQFYVVYDFRLKYVQNAQFLFDYP